MAAVRNFLKIVDFQTVIITILALISTYICNRFGFYADLPWGLIGIAIIFPIVFSINSAYRRREEALKYFASLKGHAVAIFYAHRDWVKEDSQHAERVKKLYRTPNTLRAYSQIFLNIFPILYAPYFANLCQESYKIAGYGVAILYSVVLVSLDNIQEDLESPYDSVGADDVNLDVVDEYMEVMQ